MHTLHGRSCRQCGIRPIQRWLRSVRSASRPVNLWYACAVLSNLHILRNDDTWQWSTVMPAKRNGIHMHTHTMHTHAHTQLKWPQESPSEPKVIQMSSWSIQDDTVTHFLFRINLKWTKSSQAKPSHAKKKQFVQIWFVMYLMVFEFMVCYIIAPCPFAGTSIAAFPKLLCVFVKLQKVGAARAIMFTHSTHTYALAH